MVPALAVADALRAEGCEVTFVGGERAEAQLVPAAGYELRPIRVRGLSRTNPVEAAKAGLLAAGALREARHILRDLRPAAVLGAGGYVAGPVGLAAIGGRIPLVLSEADSHLGITNRTLAPLAKRVCLAFPIEGRTGDRYVVTGRPVPPPATDRVAARERFNLAPDDTCVLVFGGSLGARSINEASIQAFLDAPYRVIHAAGERDMESLLPRVPAHGYDLRPYIEHFGEALARLRPLRRRSGGSIFEVAAHGRPAILIPYPHATGDHQASNARWMAEAGAAVVVPDDELTPQRLRAEVDALLADPARLAAMAQASARLARPDAAADAPPLETSLAAAAVAGRHNVSAEGDCEGRDGRLHFIAIGGAGMSGLALVAHALGAQVTGSDRSDSAYLEPLREEGIVPVIGHAAENIPAGDDVEVVVSTAIGADNPERAAAAARGLRELHRSELLAEVSAEKRTLAIAGTHGKTTTSSMAAHALLRMGEDPAYLIGGELRTTGRNAAWGAGEWLVVEADESDRSFLRLSPQLSVVTNIELDHHATYGSKGEVEAAFGEFLARSGRVIVWDGPDAEAFLDRSGIGEAAFFRADDVVLTPGGSEFTWAEQRVRLSVPGAHNVANAAAALTACVMMGLPRETLAGTLEDFRGAGRRFEVLGTTASGATVVDDYAHHPTEVAATLAAARTREPRRLVAVFQPHLYSRTQQLAREFGAALAAPTSSASSGSTPRARRPPTSPA